MTAIIIRTVIKSIAGEILREAGVGAVKQLYKAARKRLNKNRKDKKNKKQEILEISETPTPVE